MKKLLLIISLCFTMSYGHNLMMEVLDNEDNTLTIVGAYDTGDKAVGAMIRFESLNTGKILFKKRLPQESELTTTIPNEPYQVVLDGGPDHILIQAGISPKEGFIVNTSIASNEPSKTAQLSQAMNKTYTWSKLTISLFIVCALLFALAIYFSFVNTQKILNEIKKSNANIE